MRFLGLDVGEKTIGVAVGESLASEVTTLKAAKNKSFYRQPEIAIEALDKLAVGEMVDGYVIGMPVDQAGEKTEEAKKIAQFANHLTRETGRPVFFTNETLTSFMAAQMLEEQELSSKEVEQKVHQLAASLILQQYLEEKM